MLTKPGLGRRLVAGEVSGGVARRVSPSVNQMDGGGARRGADAPPRSKEQA